MTLSYHGSCRPATGWQPILATRQKRPRANAPSDPKNTYICLTRPGSHRIACYRCDAEKRDNPPRRCRTLSQAVALGGNLIWQPAGGVR